MLANCNNNKKLANDAAADGVVTVLAPNYTASLPQWARVVGLSVCVAAFFVPEQYALPDGVYRAWECLLVAVTIWFTILYLAKCRITIRWVALVGFFFSYYVVSSALADADGGVLHIAFSFARTAGFVTLMEYCFTNEKERICKALLLGGGVVCACHFVSFLVFKDTFGGMMGGVDQNFFLLGHDNQSVFYFLPILALMWCYSLEHGKRRMLASIVITIAVLAMYVELHSVTAMVVVAIFFVACLWLIRPLRAKYQFKMSIILVVVASLGICIAVIALSNSAEMLAAAKVFGKAGTLAPRIEIWSNALVRISNSPLYGVGLLSQETATLYLGITHCHNWLLQVLFSGGCLAAALLGFALIASFRSSSLSWRRSISGQVILLSLLLTMLAGCFDWYFHIPIPLVLIYLISFDGTIMRNDG